MLTKIPIEIIRGNGTANMLVTFDGESMTVSDISAESDVKIGSISYSKETGILTLEVVNSDAPEYYDASYVLDTIRLPGFVKVKDLPYGVQGLSGKTGKSGANGLNGVDGRDGPKGPRGFTGLRGQKGLPGPRGYTGPTGEIGYRGERGDKGLTSSKGISGQEGEVGEAGDSGENSFLPIVVSIDDPGAVGSGAIWVKPKGFQYGKDEVEFTLTGNREDVVCFETVQLLMTIKREGAAPVWFSKSLHNNDSFCYALQYRDYYVDSGALILVAECDSIQKRTTVVIKDSYIYNLEHLFENPKCCVDNTIFYLAHNDGIHTMDSEFEEITKFSLKLNDYVVYNNVHYLAAEDGLYTFANSRLNKISNIVYDKLFAREGVYASGDESYNILDNVVIPGVVLDTYPLCYYQFDETVNVFSMDGSLLWAANVDTTQNNFALCKDSYYAITPFGLKYIAENLFNVVLAENYLIEYDDIMHIERIT